MTAVGERERGYLPDSLSRELGIRTLLCGRWKSKLGNRVTAALMLDRICAGGHNPEELEIRALLINNGNCVIAVLRGG